MRELPAAGQCPSSGLCASLLRAQGALLKDRELDALALGKRNPRARLLADLEHVRQARGEGVAGAVLDRGDVERAGVALDVHERADAARVTAARDHAQVVDVELDEVRDA